MEFPVPPFKDFRFHQKRKKGKWRPVPAPAPAGPVADTHAHLQMLDDPAWSLARCAALDVDFICAMCDPTEAADRTYGMLDAWLAQADTALGSRGADGHVGAAGIDDAKDGEDVAADGDDGYSQTPAGMRGEIRPLLPHVRVACGVHPHNAKDWNDSIEQQLLSYLANPRTAALGEVGLDHHYDFSTPADQASVFARQIELAHLTGLPLILHMREGHDEGLRILDDRGWPEGGVLLHCFNLDPRTLEPWVERGCHVAFGGPVTFKNADDVRASLALVPRDRLLTETDAPYMTPEPLRGIECSPEHVLFTLDVLCDQLGCVTRQQRSELAAQLHANALDLLDRMPTPWQLEHARQAAS